MKPRHRTRKLYCRILVVIVLTAPACAAAANPWSTQVTAVSDYLFRGLSQTDHHPALQAGVSYTAGNGFHASLWGSNISWLADTSTHAASISSNVELDADAGWSVPLGKAFNLDAGLHRYVYPGSYPPGFTNPDTTEAYIGIGHGDWSLTYWHAFTNLFGIAGSRHSTYWDLTWAHDFNGRWTLSAHLGHQRVRHVANASYSDWNVGVARHFGGHLTLALGYYDSNADSGFYSNAASHYLGRATAVLSVSTTW